MDDYLEVDSVLKSYDQRVVLSDVYLYCAPGDIIAIFGRNGSGKSTLFDIIYGIRKADRSFIRANGRVIPGKLYKTGLINYLPQDNFIPSNMSVEQVIKLMGIETILCNDEFIQRIRKNHIWELSGGELRYLELLLVLNSEAPFIILDEPFYGLAPMVVERMSAYIKANVFNKGIILTDHNFLAVIDTANKYMLLEDGYLKLIHNVDDLDGIYVRSHG